MKNWINFIFYHIYAFVLTLGIQLSGGSVDVYTALLGVGIASALNTGIYLISNKYGKIAFTSFKAVTVLALIISISNLTIRFLGADARIVRSFMALFMIVSFFVIVLFDTIKEAKKYYE
jgi:hypothetical protein